MSAQQQQQQQYKKKKQNPPDSTVWTPQSMETLTSSGDFK